jgi:hypothetical protein
MQDKWSNVEMLRREGGKGREGERERERGRDACG